MQRTRNDSTGKSKLSFSMGRTILNMFPNFANDAPKYDELTPEELDTLFTFQANSPTPKLLHVSTLVLTNITSAESIAKKTLTILTKTAILICTPENPDVNMVQTGNITRNFANQHTNLPVHQQKKLVSLLFAWEEELMRWRLLEEEEAEIKSLITEEIREGGQVGQLEKRLVEIGGLKGLKPSLRTAKARVEDELPQYED